MAGTCPLAQDSVNAAAFDVRWPRARDDDLAGPGAALALPGGYESGVTAWLPARVKVSVWGGPFPLGSFQ